jgi:hypothetical protein
MPDLQNWNRIIDIPSNVVNALSTLGGTMVGNLTISKTLPTLYLLNESETSGNAHRLQVEDSGDVTLSTVDSSDTLVKTEIRVKADALPLTLYSDRLDYNGNKIIDSSGNINATTLAGETPATLPISDATQTALDNKTTGSWTFDGTTLAITGVPAP